MPDTGKLVFLFLARLRGLLLIFHLAVCLVSKRKISNPRFRQFLFDVSWQVQNGE
jgi:CRISPR/Cas system-associated protein endoribonuclease Cas2